MTEGLSSLKSLNLMSASSRVVSLSYPRTKLPSSFPALTPAGASSIIMKHVGENLLFNSSIASLKTSFFVDARPLTFTSNSSTNLLSLTMILDASLDAFLEAEASAFNIPLFLAFNKNSMAPQFTSYSPLSISSLRILFLNSANSFSSLSFSSSEFAPYFS
ncbi:160aa long hypothetical protein [Pyrococcus horikoshii OT3]|uniref:Uncharacterized protein n=1 Tax=Pyrococcus horikoshii (strain ATCC 700860 / DSM 12428 / JCM 9974 / NBRC 100139 / OT-3) TaxID=70601 RepID=O58511_PYRHO|nr:160aa long hypothetical protein [Pyrococcus horikoshii OT3]